MSRKTIALLLLLACVLGLGGWLVVGPALATHGPVAAEPPVDLDVASVVALRSDPTASSTATAAAPSSAASRSADDKARCGEDQEPVYRSADPDVDGVVHPGEPVRDADGFLRWVPDMSKPAGVGYSGAMRRFDAMLRSTGDAFDTAVADALNVDELRTMDGRLRVLVPQALTSRDARVESFVFAMCNDATLARDPGQRPNAGVSACATLDARRWAQDDPGNGIPWLYALQQADQRSDAAAQREALQQLAAASRFDTRVGQAAAAVARLPLAADTDLAAQLALAQQTLSFGIGTPYQSLTSRCHDKAGGDAEMAARCDAIASRMMAHTDSLLTRAIGGSIHKLATGDGKRLDEIHREIGDYGRRSAAQMDERPCSGERQALRRMVLVGERGEVALMQEEAASSAAR